MRLGKHILMTILFCFIFTALFGLVVFASSGTSDFTDYDILDDGIQSQKLTDEETQETQETYETQKVSEVLDYFRMTEADLLNLLDQTQDEFDMSSVSAYDLEMYRQEQLKDMGSLQLTRGFARDKITTFSDVKVLEGTGKEGIFVGLYVFHFEESLNPITDIVDQQVVMTQDHLVEVGASEIYSETINLDYVGDNYVMLTVYNPKTDEQAVTRLFKVCREEALTRDKLENVQVNFLQEDEEGPSLDTFVPDFVDFGL